MNIFKYRKFKCGVKNVIDAPKKIIIYVRYYASSSRYSGIGSIEPSEEEYTVSNTRNGQIGLRENNVRPQLIGPVIGCTVRAPRALYANSIGHGFRDSPWPFSYVNNAPTSPTMGNNKP